MTEQFNSVWTFILSALGWALGLLISVWDFLDNFAVGLLSGVAAAAFFLALQRRFFRPKLSIHPVACYFPFGEQLTALEIKILNDGWREIIDLKCHLHVVFPGKVTETKSYWTKKLELKTSEIFLLRTRKDRGEHGSFFRLQTLANQDNQKEIDRLMRQKRSRLRLQILARDPVTQVEAVIERSFKYPEDFFQGRHHGSREKKMEPLR
ncbi:hypothetical protein ACFORG_04870 [Lutimaribacter marinistellae]|uniref:Uncharacterized protein n=1 Tax=Lutimaribacter marinistellae TaxID=1820329 RepID=A0ABV7TDZ0_9RHOB